MDELEKAIAIQLDPTKVTEADLRAAQAYTAQVVASPEGLRFCCEKLFSSQSPQVKFFCLQVLTDVAKNRYATLAPPEKTGLREVLIKWIREHLVQHQDEQAAIKNKLAYILVLFFKQDYLAQWPTFFSELFGLLQLGPVVIDMFLRIIKTIDEEVVSVEVQRSAEEHTHNIAIKDRMRDDCINTMVEIWYQILVTYRTSIPQLTRECLAVLRPYITWIDLSLIVNEKFIPFFFECLPNVQFRREACDCITQVVAKGMPPLQKLDLLVRLKVLELVNSAATDDAQYKVNVAKLLNESGVQLVTAYAKGQVNEQVEAQAKQIVDSALVLLWKWMSDADNNVASVVLGFVQEYLNKVNPRPLKHATTLGNEETENLKRVLSIILVKAKYPAEFDFETKDDFESQFLAYRGVQLALFLLHAMVETKANLPEATQKTLEVFFAQAVAALVASAVFKHPHKAVVLQAFENFASYASYIPNEQALMTGILDAFVTFGLRNQDKSVRNKVSSLFMTFIRNKKSEMYPYTQHLLAALKDLLAISPDGPKLIPFEYQLYLFDAIGSLVGTGSDQDQIAFLEILLKPLVVQVKDILETGRYKEDTPTNPFWTNHLVRLVNTMGCISRGIPCEKEEKAAYWREAMDSVLRVLAALPNTPEIWDKMIYFIHQMVTAINSQLIPFIPQTITLLLANAKDPKQFLDFTSLLNQWVTKYKDKIFPILNESFLFVAQKILAITSVSVTPNSDEEREIQALRRMYYALVRSILCNNLAGVLTSEKNAPQLRGILETILTPIVESKDLRMVQLCLSVIQKTVEVWAGTVPGFNRVVCDDIAPIVFRACLRPDVSPTDKIATTLIADLAAIQKTMLQKCGQEFAQCLATKLLPMLGCDAATAQAYMQHLESAQAAQWKDFFRQFLQAAKTKK
ncbi:Exportin 1like protein [Acanthamoeba castellanii str. Neff]|uniref:Exportin-T n=1 Tax=Acanthamoeba castellanii (strain ATCC 30010 / Neff) TaxID=1257118 RepID=L8HI54_ACACF|nr:Exportin 1like protein [Acanthamoeba castellanii str. Neff]ELR25264.1 Exportin 1like protein [Acanthamoeba castellanii str. Neff]